MFSNLENKSIKYKYAGPVAVLVIAWIVVAGLFFATKDEGASAALRWLLVTFFLSFSLRPILPIDKLTVFDDCFGLSFGFSLAISFFISYICGTIFSLPFNTWICYGICIILCAVSIVLSVKKKGFYTYSLEGLSKNLKGFLLYSVVFLIFFWCIGFRPLLDSGTENYMDYGFMTTIFRQESFRPLDFWFAKEKLNYYYLGQAAAVFMTRLSFTAPEYGYNLMLCAFIATVFTGCFEIAEGFTAKITNNSRVVAPKIAGILAAFLAAFSSNFVWIIRGIIYPFYQKITNNVNGTSFWFSDPTVYINTKYGDVDNGKNEYPAYSVLLGDLHAHVVNVIFYLPLIAILFDFLFCDEKDKKRDIYRFCVLGLLLALYKGTNYWDFAIFYVICGGMIVFKSFGKDGFTKSAAIRVIKAAVIITAVSFAAALPFTVSFEAISTSVQFAKMHSPLYKLLALWGFPVIVTVLLLIFIAGKEGRIIKDNGAFWGFVALLICAWGLILVPEVVYVKDIYNETSARFNTMFKLTYVAFVLFAIIIGIAGGIFYEQGRITLLGVILSVSIFLCMYTPYAILQWQGKVTDPSERIGISTERALYIDEGYEFEMDMADVLKRDTVKKLTIVECSGDSYTHENAVSVLSGAQTVVGWFVHEWLWRDNPEVVNNRRAEVTTFYTCGDRDYCRDFLIKYDVDYIVEGRAEVLKYYIDESGFDEFGDTVIKTDYQGAPIKLIRVNKQSLKFVE